MICIVSGKDALGDVSFPSPLGVDATSAVAAKKNSETNQSLLRDKPLDWSRIRPVLSRRWVLSTDEPPCIE